MDKLIERLPEIITAAAQSYLGILALLSLSLSVLAYFFFSNASEKVRVGIFVFLALGVFGFGGAIFRVSGNAVVSPQPGVDSIATLSPEAKTLLKEAAQDAGGVVLFERFGAGVDLHTNNKSLLTDKDPRALATWESALQELVKHELLVARGERGEVFEVTKKGYDAAALK